MFKGSLVALITPMREDGTFDEKAFAEFVDWQIREGTHGIVPQTNEPFRYVSGFGVLSAFDAILTGGVSTGNAASFSRRAPVMLSNAIR